MKQKGVAQIIGIPLELIASDVLDHYRTYSLLERLLHVPSKLSEQPSFQLEPQSRSLLIEKYVPIIILLFTIYLIYNRNYVFTRYYSIDDAVARELLGKKLSSRHRKDLDEVAERTGVRIKSCRRQFDNVKRIFKTVEEMPGSIVTNIRQQFMLPENLAR